MSTSPDKLTNLMILLPTGSFACFTVFIPIITNNGDCRLAEKIIAGIIAGVFAFFCAFSYFTDSVVATNGSIWYGIVTTKGLWSAFFPKDGGIPNLQGNTYVGGGDKYKLKLSDFYVSTLSVISFCTLVLLCTPFTDCFYPGVSGSILKGIPIPVNFFIGLLFAFAPPARNGIGNGLAIKGGTRGTIEIANSESVTGNNLLHQPLHTSANVNASVKSNDHSNV